jgi:hypothetical protein
MADDGMNHVRAIYPFSPSASVILGSIDSRSFGVTQRFGG